jgi:hypothetical protein
MEVRWRTGAILKYEIEKPPKGYDTPLRGFA